MFGTHATKVNSEIDASCCLLCALHWGDGGRVGRGWGSGGKQELLVSVVETRCQVTLVQVILF